MLRDALVVIGILAVIAIACMIAFDQYQAPVIEKTPAAPVAAKPGGDVNAKKTDDAKRGPRPAEVLIFADLNSYTEWYLIRHKDRGFDLQPPKTIDFQNNQVVAV